MSCVFPEAGVNPEAMHMLSEKFNELAARTGFTKPEIIRLAGGHAGNLDETQARLQTLIQIVDALEGGYNRDGIRRWFSRPRANLQGRAPEDVLKHKWSPQDADIRVIQAMARSLRG